MQKRDTHILFHSFSTESYAHTTSYYGFLLSRFSIY